MDPRSPYLLPGERTTGTNVRKQNVQAAVAVANIVRTSLGPTGLDKMLVDDIGEVTVTNDGATILKLLDVEHPAAKVIVQLADLQDEEVGDGTTSVVLIAAELLRRAYELLQQRHHATTIITGYRLAQKRAVKYLTETLAVTREKLTRDVLMSAAKTSLSSKLVGAKGGDVFAAMAVDAMQSVKVVGVKGQVKCNVNAVNILKAHGRSTSDSQLVHGFALNCTRAAQAMPSRITAAKIACLDFGLQKAKMQMGVQIVIDDPTKLRDIQQREADITKERIVKILDAGANVVLTTKGIDDEAMKYFVDRGAMAVRRVAREDMKRIAKATGGKMILNLADLEGEESFDASNLGVAEEVGEEPVGDNALIFIKGAKTTRFSSIVLRGPNSATLDEMERSLHDALCVVKRVLESPSIVPGGGAVESALSVHLETFATSLGSREQMAVAEFAEALLVIPKTLAVNSANDAIECIARLRAAHSAAQQDPEKRRLSRMGLDLSTGKLRDCLACGVIEPTTSKAKSIAFATEAAITILRIDDLFKLEKEQKPEGGEEY